MSKAAPSITMGDGWIFSDNLKKRIKESIMRVEEEHLDVLQNIEAVIVTVYREHPEMTDYDVDKALSALSRPILPDLYFPIPLNLDQGEIQ